MRFLLDEMYPPAAAERLRERGMDALAVKESPELTGLDDAEVLALAVLDRRILVTENVGDFAVLARTSEHVGMVFCHPRRFPRVPQHLGRFVAALVALAAAPPAGLESDAFQWWLDPDTPTRDE